MSKPRVEFRINCKPVSVEEVKKMGLFHSVSLREITEGVWSYSDSIVTKWADSTWGSGWANGESFEVLSRYLTVDGKIYSEDTPEEMISGMIDVMIYGLDNPVIATVSKRYGMEAILVESQAYMKIGDSSENNVDLDLFVEEG